MQIHIGNIIRSDLRRKGLTNAWLAERVGMTERTLQRLFNKSSIDTQLLLRISVILHTDFSIYYSQAYHDMTNTDT